MRFERTEDAYPNGFEYVELAQHPAVVVVRSHLLACWALTRTRTRTRTLTRIPTLTLTRTLTLYQVPYTKSVMSFFELYRMNVPGVGLGVRVRVRVRVRALPHERAALRANPNPHPDPHPDH